MHRAVRIVVVTIVTLLALPLIAFGAYDLVAFQSRHKEIEQILTSATPDERNPTQTLKRLIRIAGHSRTSAISARMLVNYLQIPVIGHGNLGRHATNALWWGLASLHLSEDEQVTLITSRSYMGNNRYGFSAEAQARFGRQLTELNQEEVAILVAISSAPSLYLSSPELLRTRTEWLINNLQNGS